MDITNLNLAVKSDMPVGSLIQSDDINMHNYLTPEEWLNIYGLIMSQLYNHGVILTVTDLINQEHLRLVMDDDM